MAAPTRPNVSDDLIWGCIRSQNAFLVKRGGAVFSRDPLNLQNKHSRKYAGFATSRAIGVQAGENGALTVTTKNAGKAQQPAGNFNTTIYSTTTTSRKAYKGVARRAAKFNYRPDLRAAAVARVSAIRASQRPKKPAPEPKLRGAKARKAAAEKSE
ncbi:hypothetical protein VTO42DRAFT_671 [Malbranchea cinnamomea]